MTARFKRKDIDTLAKRASYLCSNPDCQAPTVGPNSDAQKSTIIGEAAHIHDANMGSARYEPLLAEPMVSEITNGIWLCRNCHREVDQNPELYSGELLHKWRLKHEENVTFRLGSKSNKLRESLLESELSEFSQYPGRIRRIVRDKPMYWEYRLTSEILRYLLAPIFQNFRGLELGLYNHSGRVLEPDE